MHDGGRVSRKIKQGPVEVDFDDCALLVNYDIEMVQLDDNGMVMSVVERKPEVRRIKIKALSQDKNMAQLASDIVDKCKYIHPSRVEEIEQLLIQLQRHNLKAQSQQQQQQSVGVAYENDDGVSRHSGGDNTGQHRKQRRSKRDSSLEDRQRDGGGHAEKQRPQAPALPPAHMDDLDEYLDMLYQVSGKSDREKEEGLRMQERGTGMILQLCRDVMNLEQLIQNGTVMGALTRVLQEEYKKSVDLTFNILRIFLAFSNFMEMHSLMANYRIGVLTMKAIEFEIKREEVRESERIEREETLQKELDDAKKGEHSEKLTFPQVLEKVRKKREKEAIKLGSLTRKQDKLLFVGFYILLNLAEDISVERKMIKKQLLPYLVTMLKRKFEDLLILCITFLKKLSMMEENKDTMKLPNMNVIELLSKMIPNSSQPLTIIILRCLFNLSFDKEIREQMMKNGLIPKLVNLLKTPIFRAKTLRLLYHLSVDDRCKSMITYTDGIPILMGLVINFPSDHIAKELGALMINLSYNTRNAELMINNKGLNLLMDRFADKRDLLVLKIIRNISYWTFTQQQELESPETQYKYRGLWTPHVRVLLDVMTETDDQDILVEVFGCLANLTVYDLPANSNWSRLVKEYNLIAMFSQMLVPGMSQNDMLLEVIMLISTIASDPQACNMIASSSIISLLYQLWEEKHDDAELMLQILHCFHKLFLHEKSREEAMYSTRIVVDIIECLQHRCRAVRNKAFLMTELVLEYDRGQDGEPGNLGRKIIQKKFESYNHAWLSAVMGNEYRGIGMEGDGLDDDDDDEDELMRDEYLLSPKRNHNMKHIQQGTGMMNAPMEMDPYYGSGDGASVEWKSDAHGGRVEGKFGDEYDHKYNEESEEEESGNYGREYGLGRGYK